MVFRGVFVIFHQIKNVFIINSFIQTIEAEFYWSKHFIFVNKISLGSRLFCEPGVFSSLDVLVVIVACFIIFVRPSMPSAVRIVLTGSRARAHVQHPKDRKA